jgi:hypothetical protein
LPENGFALNQASWEVVRQPGAGAAAYQQALRHAEVACHLDPAEPEFLNTLGIAYYRIGKYPEAITALEKSLPGHIVNGLDACELYFLAMCQYRLSNTAKAREYFQRAKDSYQRNVRRLRFTGFRTEAEMLLEKQAGAGQLKRRLGRIADLAKGCNYVKLVHEQTGKVLAIARNSAQDLALGNAILSESSAHPGAKAILTADGGSKDQQWEFERDGEYYKIVNRKTGKVLDVQSQRTEPGVAIIEWDDEDHDNQRWSWEGNEKVGRLESKSSTLVLDVRDDGEVIQRKADEKAKTQLWRVVAIKE